MAELAGVLQMQFCFDPCAIGIHRADSEMKLIADLARASSVSDELEDFQLSVGQLGDAAVILSSHRNAFKDARRDSRRAPAQL